MSPGAGSAIGTPYAWTRRVTRYSYGNYHCAFVTKRQDVARAVAAGREDRSVYRVKAEGHCYELPEEGIAELGFAVFDTAVVIAEVPRVQASRDALWSLLPSTFGGAMVPRAMTRRGTRRRRRACGETRFPRGRSNASLGSPASIFLLTWWGS
jgi:hypothetical protein